MPQKHSSLISLCIFSISMYNAPYMYALLNLLAPSLHQRQSYKYSISKTRLLLPLILDLCLCLMSHLMMRVGWWCSGEVTLRPSSQSCDVRRPSLQRSIQTITSEQRVNEELNRIRQPQTSKWAREMTSRLKWPLASIGTVWTCLDVSGPVWWCLHCARQLLAFAYTVLYLKCPHPYSGRISHLGQQ